METGSPANDPGLDITSIYGTILIGNYITALFYGVACMQVFLYFRNYATDHISIKLFVILISVLGTACTAIALASPWPQLISHWGSMTRLNTVNHVLASRLVPSTVICVVVQFFFLHRIYRLGGKNWIPLVIGLMLCTLAMLATTIAVQVYYTNAKTLAEIAIPHVVKLAEACRAVPAVVDILLAASMVTLLNRNRSLKFRSTKRMVARLTLVTINCGVWTALAALMDCVLASVYPNAFYYVLFEVPLPLLYLISAMANLNVREYVKDRNISFNSYHTQVGEAGGPIPLRSLAKDSTRRMIDANPTDIAIHVHTEKAMDSKSLDEVKTGDTLTSSRGDASTLA